MAVIAKPQGAGLVLERIALEMVLNAVGERLATLEERMNTVEEGVKNFRDFHQTVREFITRSDERAAHRASQEIRDKEAQEQIDKRRSRIHFWWLGVLSGIILLLFSFFLNWTKDFEKRHHVSDTTQSQSTTHAKEE